jgi:hypothetical protein
MCAHMYECGELVSLHVYGRILRVKKQHLLVNHDTCIRFAVLQSII